MLVEAAVSDGVAVVTLNRPDALNALSYDLQKALAAALATVDADRAVRAVVLAANGKAFTAGLDLAELSEHGLNKLPPKEYGLDPVYTLQGMKKPVVAAVGGAAVTGGFELALACDVIIVSEKAKFADTVSRYQ